MLQAVLARTRDAAVVSLGALSALHALWATGSAWPAPDRKTLADAVGGFDRFPGPGPCLAVATLLGLAASSVAGRPPPFARAARAGSLGTSLVLAARGAVGLAGGMPNAKKSRLFAALDRRVYSPVCLLLSVAALAGAVDE